jgi:hypothetical protein
MLRLTHGKNARTQAAFPSDHLPGNFPPDPQHFWHHTFECPLVGIVTPDGIVGARPSTIFIGEDWNNQRKGAVTNGHGRCIADQQGLWRSWIEGLVE